MSVVAEVLGYLWLAVLAIAIVWILASCLWHAAAPRLRHLKRAESRTVLHIAGAPPSHPRRRAGH